ncbi:MAG: phage tail protein [Streptomyces sp.]|nr:phage tail protein [Streptomyces sp.]NUS86407.1 phage tail protein [Streptomyces sp.]
MSDDVTITVRVNNQTAAGFRDINGRLRTLDGRFAGSARQASLLSNAFMDIRASLLSLAPAAVPVAASLAPIAAHAAGAGVAVAAFGAAVIPQIANLKSAADAQDKYTTAVTKYGANSKQAIQAQAFIADTLKGMPAPTQRAAAAYSNLRDQFHAFSDSTAKFTMQPVEHSFAVLGAIIPKLTPMVGATSTQLDRLLKVAGGAVNSSGFDTLSKKVSDFANQSLKNATDGAIHFIRVMSEGNAHGPITEFMAYAKQQGPAVKELLTNLMQALGNIAKGASEAGPGMLSLINAFAKLVAAVPPQLIGNLMQVYAAFKLIKLAGVGIGAVAGGFSSLATKVAALQAASVAAGGGLAGLKAAFLSLGTAAKATVVVAAITVIVGALAKLSSIGKQAPPDVDRMTTSISNLGRTGRVSGEALRVFGKDLGGLADSLRTLARPSNLDKSQQFLTSLVGMDSTPVKEAKENLDSVDKALANMVKGGKADLAKAAFNDIAKAMEKQGLTSKELRGKLDDYKSALADQALEAKLTAESQGLFGDAAQATSAKLDAQKASADGLRQSIMALNDTSRSSFDAQTRFEEALDNVTKSIKENGRTLDAGTEKGRANRDALSQLASATQDAAAKARENNASWGKVNSIFAQGRTAIIKNAEAMGYSKQQARALADQILKIPNKTAKFKGDIEDLQGKLAAAKRLLKSVPNSRKAQVRADIYDLIHKIAVAKAALNQLNNRTVTVTTVYQQVRNKGYSGNSATGGHADGGLITGPGSGTSDSIPAMLSNGEFVVNAQATGRHRQLLEAINSGQVQRFAKGGLSQAAKDARGQLRGSFGISSFGRAAGYQRTPFERDLGAPSDVNALVSSLNEAAGRIRAAFSGRTESSLLRHLNSVGRSLIKYEKQLTSVTASLSKAKDKLNSLKDAASQLSSSVKSNLIGSANITKGASGEGTLTLASVKSGMVASRDKVTAFAGALKQLKAKGFSKTIIQQVAEAGIDGGGLETAGALLQASASEVSTINQMQGQIETAAGAAGKTTADTVYAKAIKDQTAVVSKLTKQQERLEKSMASLAKSMEKLINKALHGKASGGIVGAAASGGLRSNLTWVGEQGPELLDLPAGSRVWSHPDSQRKAAAPWASMLNTPRRSPSYGTGHAAAGGGHSQLLVIQLQLGQRQFGEVWVDVGRREVRARGGIEATLKPPRGR